MQAAGVYTGDISAISNSGQSPAAFLRKLTLMGTGTSMVDWHPLFSFSSPLQVRTGRPLSIPVTEIGKEAKNSRMDSNAMHGISPKLHLALIAEFLR